MGVLIIGAQAYRVPALNYSREAPKTIALDIRGFGLRGKHNAKLSKHRNTRYLLISSFWITMNIETLGTRYSGTLDP